MLVDRHSFSQKLYNLRDCIYNAKDAYTKRIGYHNASIFMLESYLIQSLVFTQELLEIVENQAERSSEMCVNNWSFNVLEERVAKLEKLAWREHLDASTKEVV